MGWFFLIGGEKKGRAFLFVSSLKLSARIWSDNSRIALTRPEGQTHDQRHGSLNSCHPFIIEKFSLI